MDRREIRLPVALLFASACLLAQDTGPPLRVSVTLVQVDAVVTDRNGHHVPGLTKDDFEIFENGQPRIVTFCSFQEARTQTTSSPVSQPAGISREIHREDVRRTIALLVDDLKMSMASVHSTRQALKKFVSEQMAPGDLVAVISTSGVSSLQQFTTDRRLLHAAIDRIQFFLGGTGSGSSLPNLGDAVDPEEIGRLNSRRFAVGTLGAMRYVIQGMRDMPGRKSLVMFSDGFSIRPRAGQRVPPPVSVGEVRRISDRANDSAVVVYGIDPRGLVYHGLQTGDDAGNLEQEDLRKALKDREAKFHSNQEILQFLAQETGGSTFFDNNDLNAGLARVLEDQSGYYLLGFQPDEADAKRMSTEGKYRRLMVRVKRPGLRVRYRKGYLGEPDEPEKEPATPAQQLLSALNSPFAGTGVRLKLTPSFVLGEKGQPSVWALLHIDGAPIELGPPDSAGYRSATLSILAVTEGEDAASRATTERSYTIRVRPDTVDQFQKEGLVYALQHDVKRPGAYHMRVAILDAGSGRVGSASRFIEVPDVRKGALAISGITMGDGDWRPAAQTPVDSPETDRSPAIRLFHHGSPFSYGVTVYNAPFDETGQKPLVSLRARLFRGDRLVWEGTPFAVVWTEDSDRRRLPAGGVITLGGNSPPGEYLLEVQAIGQTGKSGAVSQWIDFELQSPVQSGQSKR